MSWSIEEHIGEGRPWPEQVVVYRGETDESLTYARRSLSDVNKMVELMDTLAAENAMLREQLAKARDPQRIGGTADPESFVYAIEQLREFRWQHATNDEEAIPYINNVADAHERENAKLRELIADLWKACPADGYYCIYHCEHYDKESESHCKLEDRMRELGVEVSE